MTQNSDGEAFSPGALGITSSLPLIPDPLWPWLVVPVKVPSMDQIDLFKNYTFLIGLYAKKKP